MEFSIAFSLATCDLSDFQWRFWLTILFMFLGSIKYSRTMPWDGAVIALQLILEQWQVDNQRHFYLYLLQILHDLLQIAGNSSGESQFLDTEEKWIVTSTDEFLPNMHIRNTINSLEPKKNWTFMPNCANFFLDITNGAFLRIKKYKLKQHN